MLMKRINNERIFVIYFLVSLRIAILSFIIILLELSPSFMVTKFKNDHSESDLTLNLFLATSIKKIEWDE
jgi:SNF family Na+-dependent transporter